jgi:hypothetical protein
VEHGLSLKAQELRSKVFFGMKRTNLDAIMELVEMYLQCHGISTDGLNDLGQVLLAVSQRAAKTALAGAAAGEALNAAGQPVSPALEALARAIMEKSRIFNMPMPAAIVEEGGK